MTNTVTDFHNKLLPWGEEKFAKYKIESGTSYSASGVIYIVPSGTNVTYLLHSIGWFMSDVGDNFGNGITASSSNDPNSEEWVQTWTDVYDLGAYTKEKMCSTTIGDASCAKGLITFEPMFQLDASAGQTFLIEVDGTPTANLNLVLRYYKVDTRDV